MQTALNRLAKLSGISLHSGLNTQIVIHPAPADHGVVFRRVDLPRQPRLAARYDLVEISPLCTLLKSHDASVSTIEHLMAALAGLGVDNALIDIDGPEVPILDGSAMPFAAAILKAGIKRIPGRRRTMKIVKPIRYTREDGAWAELVPHQGFRLDVTIDFPSKAIGRQTASLPHVDKDFVFHVASARTFCMARDIEDMHEAGLALGGTDRNALVFSEDGPIQGQYLRYANEPARHKLLDAIGDLALAGSPIEGAFRANKPGHALTNMLLRKLAQNPDCWVDAAVEAELVAA